MHSAPHSRRCPPRVRVRAAGNDILAVYAATREARRIGVEEGKPTMIEGMSYRINSHSTSDDDSKYRRTEPPQPGEVDERAYWEARSPITRFGKYLINLGYWDLAREEELRKHERAHAIKALNDAEALPNPHIKHLFTDVFDGMPWHLTEQMAELKEHLTTYREHYKDIPGDEIDSLRYP